MSSEERDWESSGRRVKEMFLAFIKGSWVWKSRSARSRRGSEKEDR